MKNKEYLARIADALEAISRRLDGGDAASGFELGAANAYQWTGAEASLRPVPRVARVPLEMLRGIDTVRDILFKNTEQFARGHGANNALLWVRAAWARARWSRPSMPISRRARGSSGWC